MSNFILSGPKPQDNIPNQPLGKIMFECLQKKRDHVAVIDGNSGEQFTCGEILEQSIKLAIAFREIGVKQNDVVSIISENHLKYSIPVLACWYIGAVINPLSPVYSSGELNHAASLSQPKILLASDATLPLALGLKQEITSIQKIISLGQSSENVENLEELANVSQSSVLNFKPEDNFDLDNQIAAILCSSGTTGYPKGVILSHNNVRHCMKYMTDDKYVHMTSQDCSVNILPYFHIFGLFLLVNALYTSALLIELKKFDPALYLQSIQKYKATMLVIVPSLAVFLAKSPVTEKFDLTSVNDLVCGAAPLSREIDELLKSKFRIKYTRQLYGMTELCGGATMCPWLGDTNANFEENVKLTKAGSSGILLPGIDGKVVDPETKEVLGAYKTGEFCFRGASVMKGYVGNEQATKDIFDEEGFLHTGDAGYYDEDGYFYVVDRLKELIKYKGFQVPPAELEDILLRNPAVKEVAVVGKKDERAGELPVAFVVKQPGKEVDEEELMKMVADELSVHKRLHGGVRFVENLPKNGSGKVLRRVLREMLE